MNSFRFVDFFVNSRIFNTVCITRAYTPDLSDGLIDLKKVYSTLVPHRGAPRASSHLTLDFVVPCPLSLPSRQTKDIFGQTQAG